jgi:hypothetical protein
MVSQILAFIAVAAAALVLARSAWERREYRRGTGTGGPRHVGRGRGFDRQRRRTASSRTAGGSNAIVECRLRLEASVQAAGVEHDPALTSSELTTEVLHRFPVDASVVERLGSLYREARFSTHELGEQQRAAAIDAVHVCSPLRRRRIGDQTGRIGDRRAAVPGAVIVVVLGLLMLRRRVLDAAPDEESSASATGPSRIAG